MDKNLYTGVPFSTSLLDFDKYLVHSEDNKAELYSQIKDCQVDKLKIRCDIWRLCLGVINIDSPWEEKAEQLQRERQRYQGLVNKHIKKQHIQQALQQNPSLAKNPLGRLLIPKPISAPTKQQTDDKFLEDEIRKDVQRTYQQKQFFRNIDIIKILSRVLFIWSKQFPDISYKQGINQVSASVIWVYFSSAIDPNSKYLQYDGIVEQLRQKYLLFHSNKHAEADIYSIFDKMMNSGHKQMFRSENQTNKQLNPNSKNNSPILQRIIKLSDIKFKLIDGELFRHIKLNEVSMRTFLLRWIRCIHTREFELQESFSLWDNIFLAFHLDPKQGLSFIDCTTLAMLVYLRDIALKKDSGFQILQLYQKYPKVQGKYLQEVVNLSWIVQQHLQNACQKQSQKKKQFQGYQNYLPQRTVAQKTNSSAGEQQSSVCRSQSKLNYPDFDQSQSKKVCVDGKSWMDMRDKDRVMGQKKGVNSKVLKKQYQFNISFSRKQWKQIQCLMKKSIQQNTDSQSRCLMMRVMKAFSDKQQQQIKKIESSNSLIDLQ